MSKRFRIIGATVMTIFGVGLLALPLFGGTDLKAAGVNEIGVDFSTIFIGAGVGLLALSALFFLSAGSE